MAVSGIGDYVQIQLQKNQTNSMDSIALISQKLVERIKAERKDTAVDLTRPDYVRASSERGRLMGYKSKVADELSAMTKAKGAVEWAASKLNTMLAKAQARLAELSRLAPLATAPQAADIQAAEARVAAYSTPNIVQGLFADAFTSPAGAAAFASDLRAAIKSRSRSEEHTSELQSH